MSNKIGNLIFGIVLLVIALANLGTAAVSSSITLRTIVLDGSLLLFAVSRFMMFGGLGIAMIRPLRTIALVGVVVSYLIPRT